MFATLLQAECFSCPAQGHERQHRLWGPTGRLLQSPARGKMTLERQIFQQGGSRKRGRCRHCWVSWSTPDSCLQSESHRAVHFSVLQLYCALVLFFRYFIGLAGSKIWLSVLREKDEYHCLYDSDINHSPCVPVYSAWITHRLNTSKPPLRKVFQHKQLVGSATDRGLQGKWLSPRQQRLMGNWEIK